MDITKASNPKDAIGATKLPLDLLPPTALAYAALAHFDGSLKYGRWNWRLAGVRASIYAAAAMRHIERWFHGQDNDPDSGIHNLGHAIACLNIIIDAQVFNMLVDDRAPSIDLTAFFAEMNLSVAELRKLHEGRSPRHYDISDKVEGLDGPAAVAPAVMPPDPYIIDPPKWNGADRRRNSSLGSLGSGWYRRVGDPE